MTSPRLSGPRPPFLGRLWKRFRGAIIGVAVFALMLGVWSTPKPPEPDPDLEKSPPPPARWSLRSDDVGGGTAERGSWYQWGDDACGVAYSIIDLYADAEKAGGFWESRSFPSRPDHPIAVVTQVLGVPDNDALALEPGFEMQDLWEHVQACGRSAVETGLRSFEVLGEAPVPGAWSAAFGWRAEMQGPWYSDAHPELPYPPRGGVQRGDAEVWYLEMWIALVNGNVVVVAGTEGPDPAVLNTRDLLTTMIRRVEEDPPPMHTTPPFVPFWDSRSSREWTW